MGGGMFGLAVHFVQAIPPETIDGTMSEVGEEVVMWVEEQFIDSIKDAFAKSVMMS